MSLTHPRKNGKQLQSFLQSSEVVELEAVAKKYRPMLEALKVLDGLSAYQEVMLFVWLWKHDKGIEDAARGIGELRIEWEGE